MVTFSVPEAVALLERTPQVFRALLAGLQAPWIVADEGPDTFSALENLGHLIHGERTDWIPRAVLIVAQGPHRRFEPYDRFAQRREMAGKTLVQLLDEFDDLRARSLARLCGWELTDAQLDLEGEHPALGTVTLRQLLPMSRSLRGCSLP